MCCYRCNKASYVARDCPGNEDRDVDLLSRQTMNETLLVIRILVNETLAARLCCVWKNRSVRETTISSEMCKCHGIGTVIVRTDTGNSADVEALVVYERQLDFDLLLGYDAFKALGGVLITWTGMVKSC